MKRIPHPSGSEIVFDPKWHQYKIGHTTLRSVSKLLDKYFPFDEKRILQLVSRKTGEPVDVIKRNWSRQALLGKNIHEYIECKLLDKPPPTFLLLVKAKQKREAQRPTDATGPLSSSSIEEDLLHGEEELYLPAADSAVLTIKSAYDIVGVEQVIAVPEWGIAGTIDFIGRNKNNNKILIGDWKTSGSTTSNFRFGSFETPCSGCLRHLPNAKFYRYAMQVIAYGEMLKREEYFERGFFDAQLREMLAKRALDASPDATTASAGGGTEEPKGRNKNGGRGKAKSKKAAPIIPVGDAPLVTLDFYHGDIAQKMEYGIVQISKDEQGAPVVEYKEVTAVTVLPPDIPEMSFNELLKDVMAGN